ncbi:MAG TPA: HD domain-containing phosphohydrolase [Vicinamibacterales bacterium]|jgi:diguanylate cyclase (GGDEF)-like protein/putative nucleotidyltransferase with HDIG domain
MVSQSGLTRFGKAYVWTIIVAGFLVVGGSIYQMYIEPIHSQWFILAALTLISGSATVRLPSTYASISISETFVITAVLLYGPAAGTVIVALDGLVGSFWISKRNNEIHRALFNVSAPALSGWTSAHLFFLVAGIAPLVKEPSSTDAILPALVVFALSYFGLNSWLIAFAIGLEKHLSPIRVWKTGFGWLSLNYFGGASVAFLLVGYNRTINLGYVGAIIPLLLVLYFTFKAAMGRVEDADKHVEQLNRMYLSTIETLAMAIDAKDQVTHGHIRRVQSHATSLAREVGVHDDKLLKAIEAAALLHDMGKLAVPEYILNKPGKLSEAEFEKMKLHAAVGADILSAIDFPYPVVPIVRHHHENWDGTGYPTGIKGTDIPIGARILSVVDCFDALTSDRPYRARLSDEEAIEILLQRRGSMYDPLVVDTFLRVHSKVPTPLPRSGPPSDVLNTIAHSRRTAPADQRIASGDEITTSADEMLAIYDIARALAGQVHLGDAGDVIAKHLRKLIPSSLCVFYLYSTTNDEIEAQHAVGDGASLVRGLKVSLGQRLSGWVAANRQTISNSDPFLDLGDIARGPALMLNSTLSTPLIADDKLVGVLALYSKDHNGFQDTHRRIIEMVAREIARTFKRASEFESSARRDVVTRLPNVKQLEQFVESAGVDRIAKDAQFTLLIIDVVNLRGINATHGRDTGDDVLRHVARQTTAGLRVADILFRYASDEFVALLNETSSEVGRAIANRIRENIASNSLVSTINDIVAVDVVVTAVSTPGDGGSLQELMTTGRQRAAEATSDHQSTRVG